MLLLAPVNLRQTQPLRLGQPSRLGWVAPFISAGIQAGAAIYSSHMQSVIAKQNLQFQKDMQKRQEAAAAAKDAAAAAAQAAAIKAQAEQAGIVPGQPGGGAAQETIMGIDRNTFIVGGIGVAVAVGAIAIFAGGGA